MYYKNKTEFLDCDLEFQQPVRKNKCLLTICKTQLGPKKFSRAVSLFNKYNSYPKC